VKNFEVNGHDISGSLPTYIHMMEEAEAIISELLTGYPKASKMWNLLKDDPEVNADWDMSNRGLR
jgi:metal-dependent HD superfamily phosphatase/phosphodiesterase